MNKSTSSPKLLGVFTLAMISVSAIIALRNLPLFAKNGLAIITVLLIASLMFFIPIALVCAELASGWPKSGGLFAWVKEAFGNKNGALAVWLEWIESVVWLPTVLSFLATSIAYLVSPDLTENRYFMLFAMLAILWSGTILNFLSTTTSGWISAIGIIIGSIVPGLLLIGLAGVWIATGNPIEFSISWPAMLPDMKFDSITDFLSPLSFLTGIALAFTGIEVAAFYIKETKQPNRTFPLATLISAITIIVIYVLGALSVAMVVPKEEINLAAGTMQAIQVFFEHFHIGWATPIFAGMLVIGGLALLNTWIIGPSKGLLTSAQSGNLPAFTEKTNHAGSPIAILLMQAIIGSALICTNLLIPTMNQFYMMFTLQAAQLVLMMYFLIFISAIKLRYSQPNVERAYKIPGGKFGIWLVAGTGASFCVLAFLLGFIPPEEYQFTSQFKYTAIMLAGIIIFSAPPFIWHHKVKSKQLD